MKEKMRTIGYLCPRCRKPVMQQRSRFALAASGAIVQCECGKSELQIDFDGEKFRKTAGEDFARYTGRWLATALPPRSKRT